MKKQLLRLFQKTYFYTQAGQDGLRQLHGSGYLTTWIWVPFSVVYIDALNAVINEAMAAHPERDYAPYFTSFKRIR